MAKYTGVYLNQDEGNKWTASYWIAAVSKWVHYTILGDKDGNLIDSAHPLDVKAAANSGVDIGDVDVLSSALPTGAATSAKQDTLAGLVGEVQESPTENTVLERLKTIETELTDIKSTSGVKKITDAVVLGASTAEIGKLAAGTAEIGAVTISGCIPTDIDKSPLVSLIYLQGGILCRYCVWNHSPKPHGYRSSFRPSD